MRLEERVTFRMSKWMRRIVRVAAKEYRNEGDFIREAVREALIKRGLWPKEASSDEVCDTPKLCD